MYKDIIIAKESVETHIFCDVCETEIKRSFACSAARCECCKKDLCEKCIAYEDSSCGDYRTVYCESCWAIGKPYNDKILHYETLVDKAYDEWEEKCKEIQNR